MYLTHPFQTGFFANPASNYFAAPQTVNDQGFLKGHSHVVIEPVDSFKSDNPLNPLDFAFFKGLNAGAVDGVLSTEVTDGLSPGVYKLSSVSEGLVYLAYSSLFQPFRSIHQ